jgi:hypothetical protein
VVHQLFTSEDADPGAMARIGPQRERFSPPRASGRFSIAADVKARPDRLVLRVGLPVTRGSRFSSRSAPGRLMMG